MSKILRGSLFCNAFQNGGKNRANFQTEKLTFHGQHTFYLKFNSITVKIHEKMKKHVFILVTLLYFSHLTMNAQTEEGTWLLGGTANFSFFMNIGFQIHFNNKKD
jgi:hypothetical protein